MFIWFALLDIRIELRQSNNLKDEQNDFLTQIRNKL